MITDKIDVSLLPRGFSYSAEGRVGLIVSVPACAVAGTTTSNKCPAAPVIYSRAVLERGRARAIVVNSGNANACTGPQGLQDASAMARTVASELNIAAEEVVVASTGKIGIPLDMDLIKSRIVAAGYALAKDKAEDVARVIMTTDTRLKICQVDLGDAKILGIAKGSGMIHPDMATMLCFIMTDAQVESSEAQELLTIAVQDSFNMISVDGDTSTNDMCVLLANGQAGQVSRARFLRGLRQVCQSLAIDIARDGEGAQKLICVRAVHAVSADDARAVAKTVVASPLVKTAVAGGDPNWGRVAAASGRSGVKINQDKLKITMEGLDTDQVTITVDLNMGIYDACAWGCDLTYGYIDINTKYN